MSRGAGLITAEEASRTRSRGTIRFGTTAPVGGMLHATGRHACRPAHIHFIVSADGFEAVTMHLFVLDDPAHATFASVSNP